MKKPINDSQRRERLHQAQLEVRLCAPFFVAGVLRLPVEFVGLAEYQARFCGPGLAATACTDGEKLYWCSEWFDILPDQVLVTLLCHEVCHCLLGHLWRGIGLDHLRFNVACDHAVNLMLKEFAAMQTGKRLADPFPFPTDYPGVADPQYSGLSEEAIYAKLGFPTQTQSQAVALSVGQGAVKGGQSASNQPAGGKNAPTGNSGANNTRQDLPSFGQFKAKPGASDVGKKLKEDWEGTLIQSVQSMRGRGELPAGLQRLVDQLVSPSVNWWEVLRNWLREQCSDDYCWLTPATEFSECGFILPSLKSERMSSVVFAVDTSGSISADILSRFRSEEQSALDTMRPKSLVEICCDAKVQQVKEYSSGDIIGGPAPGGGGTVFQGIWDCVAAMPIQPKCIVVLTDCQADFGNDPGLPVMFVCWEKHGKAPFGEVIHAQASS